MEENDQAQSPVSEQPAQTPVMDVQTAPVVTEESTASVLDVPESPLVTEPSQPADQPETPVQSTAPEESAPTETPATPPEETPTEADKKQVDQLPKPKRNIPLAVILAVIVALLLAGTAVFAYMNTRETAPEEGPGSQSEAAVNPEDVDKTIQQIDDNLNSLDENADFIEEELTDEVLDLEVQ